MVDFNPGDRVAISAFPPFLKTAEPMPMLRPPDLVTVGEEGVVVEAYPKAYWAVRFKRGVFLIDQQYLEKVEAAAGAPSEDHG